MKAQELIKQFGQVINVPNLALSKNNICSLSFDENVIDFELLPDKNLFYLVSNIGELDYADPKTCYEKLLEANRFGSKTGGACLSIDSERNCVVIHKILDISAMEHVKFFQEVDGFLGWVTYWKENYNLSA